jgi:hypothetical protein
MDVMTVLHAADLLGRPAAALDQLFLDADAGTVPVGPMRGTALLLTGTPASRAFAWVTRRTSWQGKEFDPETRRLKNLLTPFGVHAISADVRGDMSLLDGRPCIVLDYSATSKVAHWIRDEIREVAPGLYLGMVFWGGRRLPLRFTLATG